MTFNQSSLPDKCLILMPFRDIDAYKYRSFLYQESKMQSTHAAYANEKLKH